MQGIRALRPAGRAKLLETMPTRETPPHKDDYLELFPIGGEYVAVHKRQGLERRGVLATYPSAMGKGLLKGPQAAAPEGSGLPALSVTHRLLDACFRILGRGNPAKEGFPGFASPTRFSREIFICALLAGAFMAGYWRDPSRPGGVARVDIGMSAATPDRRPPAGRDP
jgi:hypothetical protein